MRYGEIHALRIFFVILLGMRAKLFCGLCAQQLLSDFVLGLWTSSDVFCSFRRLIFATGRRLLRGKLCDGLRTIAAWKYKRMRQR